MTKPDISKLPADIRKYIQWLEQRADDTDQDGIPHLLRVMNRKINQIARSIDAYEFKIDSNEDRAYERFWTAAKDIKKIADDLNALRLSLGLKEEEATKQKLSPQEQLVLNRKNDSNKANADQLR